LHATSSGVQDSAVHILRLATRSGISSEESYTTKAFTLPRTEPDAALNLSAAGQLGGYQLPLREGAYFAMRDGVIDLPPILREVRDILPDYPWDYEPRPFLPFAGAAAGGSSDANNEPRYVSVPIEGFTLYPICPSGQTCNDDDIFGRYHRDGNYNIYIRHYWSFSDELTDLRFVLNGTIEENRNRIVFGDWTIITHDLPHVRLNCRDRNLDRDIAAEDDSYIEPYNNGTQTLYVCRNTITRQELRNKGGGGYGLKRYPYFVDKVLHFTEHTGTSSDESFVTPSFFAPLLDTSSVADPTAHGELGGYLLPLADGAHFDLQLITEDSNRSFATSVACPGGQTCHSVAFDTSYINEKNIATLTVHLNGSPSANRDRIRPGFWHILRPGAQPLTLDCRDQNLSEDTSADNDSYISSYNSGRQTLYVCQDTIIARKSVDFWGASGSSATAVFAIARTAATRSVNPAASGELGGYTLPLAEGALFYLQQASPQATPSPQASGGSAPSTAPAASTGASFTTRFTCPSGQTCHSAALKLTSENGQRTAALELVLNGTTTANRELVALGDWTFIRHDLPALKLDCRDRNLLRNDNAQNDNYVLAHGSTTDTAANTTQTLYVCRNTITRTVTQEQFNTLTQQVDDDRYFITDALVFTRRTATSAAASFAAFPRVEPSASPDHTETGKLGGYPLPLPVGAYFDLEQTSHSALGSAFSTSFVCPSGQTCAGVDLTFGGGSEGYVALVTIRYNGSPTRNQQLMALGDWHLVRVGIPALRLDCRDESLVLNTGATSDGYIRSVGTQTYYYCRNTLTRDQFNAWNKAINNDTTDTTLHLTRRTATSSARSSLTFPRAEPSANPDHTTTGELGGYTLPLPAGAYFDLRQTSTSSVGHGFTTRFACPTGQTCSRIYFSLTSAQGAHSAAIRIQYNGSFAQNRELMAFGEWYLVRHGLPALSLHCQDENLFLDNNRLDDNYVRYFGGKTNFYCRTGLTQNQFNAWNTAIPANDTTATTLHFIRRTGESSAESFITEGFAHPRTERTLTSNPTAPNQFDRYPLPLPAGAYFPMRQTSTTSTGRSFSLNAACPTGTTCPSPIRLDLSSANGKYTARINQNMNNATNSSIRSGDWYFIRHGSTPLKLDCRDKNLAENTNADNDSYTTAPIPYQQNRVTSYTCRNTITQTQYNKLNRSIPEDQHTNIFTANFLHFTAESCRNIHLGQCLPFTTGTTFKLCSTPSRNILGDYLNNYEYEADECFNSIASRNVDLQIEYDNSTVTLNYELSNQKNLLLPSTDGDSLNHRLFASGYWKLSSPSSSYSIVMNCTDPNFTLASHEVLNDVSANIFGSSDSPHVNYKCVNRNMNPGTLRTFDRLGNTITLTYLGTQAQSSVYAPNITLLGMEVTQGTQDLEGSLSLVRNRQTAVRVFFETATGQTKITASLKATRSDGIAPITTRIAPYNDEGYVSISSNLFTHEYRARRANIDSTLNFILPADWIDLVTGITLTLRLDFHTNEQENIVNCQEKIEPVNTCSANVTFTQVSLPNIVMFPIPLQLSDDEDEIPSKPLDLDLQKELNVIETVLPFPQNSSLLTPESHEFMIQGYSNTLLTVRKNEDGGKRCKNGDFELKQALDKLKKLKKKNGNSSDIYVGILRGSASLNSSLGCASLENRVSVWYNETHLSNNAAHEIGHNLELFHPGQRVDGKNIGLCDENGTIDNYEAIGRDGITAGVIADPYPTNDFDNSRTDINEGDLRPLLGPIGDANKEVWGLDIDLMDKKYRYSSEQWGAEGLLESRIISDPRDVHELMSYCTDSRWVEAFDQHQPPHNGWLGNKHLQNIITLFDVTRSGGASGTSGVVPSDLFIGKILFDDNVESGVQLDRVYSRPRLVEPGEPGDYILVLHDSTGSNIRQIPFRATKEKFSDGSVSEEANFSILVYDPPDYSSFSIKKKGEDKNLFFSVRSSNNPTVILSGIADGQLFSHEETIDLSFMGVDIDGDTLSYEIYYSTDRGASYEVINLETFQTSLSLRADDFPGSNNARFGVSVSDGTRSTFVETPIFRIENHAPEVRIDGASDRVLVGYQGFILDAWGYDKENGLLPHSAFTWRSSADGYLGTGSYLVLSTDQLTPGEHIITVSVTDNTGLSSTDSTTIIVNMDNSNPEAVDDNLSALLSEPVLFDVLANDNSGGGNTSNLNLEIVEYPELGHAEIVTSPMGSSTIRYQGHTSGYDNFQYEICDQIGRCDTATVILQVGLSSCTVFGTESDDRLVGTSEDDVICGLAGNDIIDGLGGSDIILAGAGDDTIYGRLGDDVIRGEAGNDIILGHRGDDNIYGGQGDDNIYGGDGDDTIRGDDGADTLSGEAGNDIIEGGKGSDIIGGGRGDDTIRGGPGNDNIRGNSGADTIDGGTGTDTILGVAAEDTVTDEQ